jgi:hypothetical protein
LPVFEDVRDGDRSAPRIRWSSRAATQMSKAIGIALLAALLPAPVLAQRADISALRDSLTGLSDVPVLRRLQAQTAMPGVANTADEVIRRGMIGLRIYELTQDRADSDRAREVFEDPSMPRFDQVRCSHWMQESSKSNVASCVSGVSWSSSKWYFAPPQETNFGTSTSSPQRATSRAWMPLFPHSPVP